jgi:chondroitin AC lyase
MLTQIPCAFPVLLIFLLSSFENINAQLPAAHGDKKTKIVYPATDLEIIRERVIEDLLQPAVDEASIRTLLKSIKANGSWPDINYKDVTRTGFQPSRHLQRMFELSRAYKKRGSAFYQNAEVKKSAFSALNFWLQHDFICDNWWWNEMGTPNWMINTLLVMDTDLNEKQIREGLRIAGRANLEASGARPGGDLIQIAGMLGKQALFRRDETVLEKVVSVIANEISITPGRGLKPDLSFHHRVDNVISTLSYGLGYATSFSYWAVKITGTKYTFPKHAVNLLIDYYLDGICKSMVYGKFPDPGAKNRDLSRKGTLNAATAELPENLLKISGYRRAELETIVKIRKGEITPVLSWNRFYWHSEYFTHQRPGYFSSVRMHSSRNHTMEQPHNEEGLKNHHVGDGSNFISVTGKEYLDIFPVWDWQKIPGTTVVQKPVHLHWHEIAKKGLTDFVGAVSDGFYGAAAFDFQSAHDPLKARKAWFFFDKEYLCLGTGISAEADHRVLTTLNQCLLTNDVLVRSRKKTLVLEKGEHALHNVSWILHANVGYVFTKPHAVNISNRVATGSWREITHQAGASDEAVQQEVFTAWLDHGIKPRQAAYEYIVIPVTDPASLDLYAKDSPIVVLSNTEEAQGVYHRDLNRGQMVFYQPGKVKVTDQVTLTTESPCMVMLKMNGKTVEQICVSDPSRELKTLEIKITAVIEGSGTNWRAEWDKNEKVSLIKIELPDEGDAGKSVLITTYYP